jgi:formiminotetrahydrofolate cyclodeaminase
MDPDRLTALPTRELVERLASSDPIPGGGSASALAGAMGAALVRMVVALTVDRPAAAGNERELTEIATAAASCQSELLNLAELDAIAYDGVVRARRMPKDTDLERRARAVQAEAAVREAIRAPLNTARMATQVLGLAERLAPIGNRHAVSDVGVGALLASVAIRGAAMNVRINLPSLPEDDELRRDAAAEVGELTQNLEDRTARVSRAVEARIG